MLMNIWIYESIPQIEGLLLQIESVQSKDVEQSEKEGTIISSILPFLGWWDKNC